jgi:hypothetical protein
MDSTGSVHDLREGRCGHVSDSQLVTYAHRTHTEPGYVPVRIWTCRIQSDICHTSATGPQFAVHSCTYGCEQALIKFVSITRYSFVRVKFVGQT